MFWALVILFFALDMGLAPYIGKMALRSQLAIEHIIVFVVALCGMYGMKAPTHKARHAFTVIVAYTGFSAIFVPVWLKLFLSCLFLIAALWIAARPSTFRSDDLTTDTVCLAFYSGDSGSFLMHLFGMIGLPVKSMSIIVGNEWIKLVNGVPTLQAVNVNEMHTDKYVVVDTGVKIDEEIKAAASQIIGAPARTEGSWWLRLRCIAIAKPLLSVMGTQYEPRTVLEQIPSIYFYRCVDRLGRGRK